jgi:hypothetical protein
MESLDASNENIAVEGQVNPAPDQNQVENNNNANPQPVE